MNDNETRIKGLQEVDEWEKAKERAKSETNSGLAHSLGICGAGALDHLHRRAYEQEADKRIREMENALGGQD